jgi:hypothetical protein
MAPNTSAPQLRTFPKFLQFDLTEFTRFADAKTRAGTRGGAP